MASPFDGLPSVFLGAFGEAVTLVDSEGVEHATTGVFRAQSVDALGMTQPGAVLHVSSADAAKVADGDTVRVGSVEYVVRVEEPDGKGMVPMRLEAI